MFVNRLDFFTESETGSATYPKPDSVNRMLPNQPDTKLQGHRQPQRGGRVYSQSPGVTGHVK